MLPEPTTTLQLPDGRVLACDDVGDRDGDVVVWLHGAPDCRLARHPDDGIAAAMGVRLVAVDRPGYGWSDPPAPDPRTFGDELGLLLDELGVDRCSVAAWSAGVPWALGAAASLGERVMRVVSFGAVAPIEAIDDPAVAADSRARAHLFQAVAAGELTGDELADELTMLLVPTPPVPLEQARDQVVESTSDDIRAVPELVDQMARSLAAAVDRHADAGLRSDIVLQATPGVVALLPDVACDVVLVHGSRDGVGGPAVGAWLAARLPSARVEVWEDAGHGACLLEWPRLLRVATGS